MISKKKHIVFLSLKSDFVSANRTDPDEMLYLPKYMFTGIKYTDRCFRYCDTRANSIDPDQTAL